jgi:hypothetical protein
MFPALIVLRTLKAGGIKMQNLSELNFTIGRALMQQLSPDPRNVSTFLAAVTAFLASQSASFSMWLIWLSCGIKAASCIRHFSRWMSNSSILPHVWYGPIFRYAMRGWTQMPIFLVLDTSMLYDNFCCVRISMVYLNRAIPVTWCVLEHKSASVKYEQYSHLLDQARSLLPRDVEIIFLADRGFVSKKLMRRLQTLNWSWRIRIKSNQKLLLHGRVFMPKTLPLSLGRALLFTRNINFGKGLEHLSLSAGWAKGSREAWYVLSGDMASTEVFMDYARRFDIEEGFRDEKSGGFDLEKSRIRDAQKLERLILVLSTALIVAVSEGVSVVLEEKREEVDSHQKQGLSYFQVGLRWFVSFLIHGARKFFCHVLLRPMNNPIPVAPTEKESRKRRKMKDPTYLFTDVHHCVALSS